MRRNSDIRFDSNRKAVRHIAGILIVLALLVVIFPGRILCLVGFFAGYGRIYETNNLRDYGMIKGNFDNDKPEQFIQSFFPYELDSGFQDVSYHYKAIKFDTYAFEAHLEFTISDPASFEQYVAVLASANTFQPFRYDDSYMECSLEDTYRFVEGDPSGPSISNALIGKILYSTAEQKVIYTALGVYDGGATGADELNHFFTVFGIDPTEYERTTTTSNSAVNVAVNVF